MIKYTPLFSTKAGTTSQQPPPLPDFSWLKTRNMSAFIRPTEETALAAPKACGAEENVDLLVFVTSAPPKVESRRVIRKTWGRKLQNSASNVKVFFALGRTKDKTVHDNVNKTHY